MDENELNRIDLSEEQRRDIEEGNVEIASGTTGGSGSSRKKGAGRFLVFLLGILMGVVVTGVACIFMILIPAAKERKQLETANEKEVLHSDEVLKKIDRLKGIIDSFYYEDVSDEEMEESLYKGLVNSTHDKYTTYYSAEELKVMNEDWEGKFYGIGATLTIDEDSKYTYIDSVEPNSPAQNAGIRGGDYIIEVDGVDVAGKTLTEVVRMVRGDENTEVRLTIARNGQRMEFSIIRGEITSEDVSYEKKDDGIAYIRLATFSDVSVDQFIEKMEEAKKDHAEGVILDLRGNPGGGLDVVTDICEQFLPEGLVVYTEDKMGNRKEYFSDGANEWKIPMVVLVDGSSASASEILTAAVKDMGVATVVGTKTYGKGVYQSVVPLGDGSAVKITAGRFYSPKGVCFHGVGIEPDVEVEFDADAYLKDETDNQLDKAMEVLKEKMSK